jgi:hypothetical protein
VIKPAPSAAGQAIGPLQAGDAGPEASELSIHPTAPDHVFNPGAALLMEGHVAYTPGLGLAQVFTACIAAVGGGLPRRLAIDGGVALQ